MRMKPGQTIEVQLEDAAGAPLRLENVFLEIRLFTRGNYRYGFNIGRTDGSGKLRVSYPDVENMRAENAKQSLMDYNTPLIDCDPTVEIRVPTEEELRGRVETVRKTYGTVPKWAQHWPSNGEIEAEPRMIKLEDSLTQVAIPSLSRAAKAK
jgi:hypothetical protein